MERPTSKLRAYRESHCPVQSFVASGTQTLLSHFSHTVQQSSSPVGPQHAPSQQDGVSLFMQIVSTPSGQQMRGSLTFPWHVLPSGQQPPIACTPNWQHASLVPQQKPISLAGSSGSQHCVPDTGPQQVPLQQVPSSSVSQV